MLWVWLGLASACSEPGAPVASRPAFELFPVVERSMALLEDELAAARDDAPGATPEGREVEEEVRGLVTFLASSPPALRSSVIADLERVGPSATPTLAALAVSETASADERAAAIELLGALDDVRSAEQLLSLVEASRVGWVRSHAAWRLGQGTQDWVVPRLVLRLKYETDFEAVVWIACALARFSNYSGVAGLANVARSAPDDAVRTLAADELARILAKFDTEELARRGGGTDATGLEWAWSRWDGSPASETAGLFSEPERSARYRLAVWREIRSLGDFQLRGVDDARFVLSNLGPSAAVLLARALHDASPHVRVHAAQCLERMGPRASIAGGELVKALSDPELAPSAAAALGRVGHPEAASALAACTLRGGDLGLRVAAARALGGLGLASSVPALASLLDPSEPVDLRQAAAEAIAYAGAGERTAAQLCAFLESTEVDPTSSAAALRHWLAQREREGSLRARAVLEEWDALNGPVGVVETREEIAARRRARAALVRGALPELLR